MASVKKTDVAFLSVSSESSTSQLIKQINLKNDDLRCIIVKLTQQDLHSFQPRDTYDAVVLLHSISQGRNSITDVADAKYSKLLPQLKKKYGPDRVAVVVHSMPSFNPNTKMALMMVFKRSQPTTFECSKCVIQCNNPAEIPDQDLSQLTEFVREAPSHSLPIPEVEAPSKPNAASSSNNTMAPGNDPKVPAEVPDKDLSKLTELVREASSHSLPISEVKAPSKPNAASSTDKLSKMAPGNDPKDRPISGSAADGNQSKAISVSNVDKTESVSNKKSASAQKDLSSTSHHDTTRHPLEDDVISESNRNQTADGQREIDRSSDAGLRDVNLSINTTYPIALVGRLPSKHLTVNLLPHLPGKTIMPIKDINDLKSNSHLFEAIFHVLVDVGTSGTLHLSSDLHTHSKNMLVTGNVALLMPSNVPSANKHAKDAIEDLAKNNGVKIFQYTEHDGQLCFDGDTDQLVNWLRHCYARYDPVAQSKGWPFMKKIRNFMSNLYWRR